MSTHPHPHDPQRPDVVMKETRYRREPGTTIYIAAGALITLLVLGLFWVFQGESERERRLVTNTEVIVNDQTDALKRDEFLEVTSVELRDLRTDADLLARNASAENRTRIDAYSTRVGELESRLSQVPNGTLGQSERAELQSELAAVREEYRALETELRETTADLEQEAEQANEIATEAVAAAEVARDDAAQAELIAFVDNTDDKVEELGEELQELRTGSNAGDFSAEVEELQRELDLVAGRVSTIQTAPTEGIQALQQEITQTLLSLEERIEALDAQTAMR